MQPEELKAIRKGLGMSQQQFADELGLSMNFVSMMERGTKEIERRTELAAWQLEQTKGVITVDMPDVDGLPSADEFRRWQELYRKHVPAGSYEGLVGLRMLSTGKLMAICRGPNGDEG